MARNKHHEDLTRMLDVELADKLTTEEREQIYELCVSAMIDARKSGKRASNLNLSHSDEKQSHNIFVLAWNLLRNLRNLGNH